MKEEKELEQRRMLNKARDLEKRINDRLSNIKPLTICEYFMLLTFIFISMGVSMFFICILSGINVWFVNSSSSPLLYLILGLISFGFYSFYKNK